MKTDKPRPKTLWAIMKAFQWDTVSANGIKFSPPPEGPHMFIPVFNTREGAVKWAESDEHVAMLGVGPQ
jgi:hypothetical protein